jgi:quercetin dioxygenase-like cupin family protein
MRRVVTGVGADGRSTVFSDGHAPVAFAPQPDGSGAFGLRRIKGGTVDPSMGASVVNELWALTGDPSVTTDDPTIDLESFAVNVPAGETRWIITQMGPGLAAAMHRTPTIDYGLVVAGDVELGLEDGSVHLHAGDSVVVNGVEHSWLAGPNGCLIATVMVGLRDSER